MKNKKAFTLIELVSVLVILAILALIVTPLVLNIIRKARTAADKRSIDAYGRSIELAIADYLLDNGTFPTSIDQLTIEYSGDRVVCSTTQLNSDSSVYLAECTVNNREITGYTYGKEEIVTYEAYNVGDEVTYNNVDYYVIANSDETESTVTLLKSTPLTVEEVNEYGSGHINRYTASSQSTAYDNNGYGAMAYYSSQTCGYVNGEWVETGCNINYIQSDIKYVVDSWKNIKASTAIEARLITLNEMIDNLGIEWKQVNPTSEGYRPSEGTPDWLFLTNRIEYWSQTNVDDNQNMVYTIADIEYIYQKAVYNEYTHKFLGVVRPVIVLSKSVLN